MLVAMIDLADYTLPTGRIDVASAASEDHGVWYLSRTGTSILRPGRDMFSLTCKFPRRIWSYSLKHVSDDFYSQVTVLDVEDVVRMVPSMEADIRRIDAYDRITHPDWYTPEGPPACSGCQAYRKEHGTVDPECPVHGTEAQDRNKARYERERAERADVRLRVETARSAGYQEGYRKGFEDGVRGGLVKPPE